MTREEFVDKIRDGYVCVCSNAEQCAEVANYLLTLHDFRLLDKELEYHLDPQNNGAIHSFYTSPGVSDRVSRVNGFYQLSFYSHRYSGQHVNYEDFAASEDGSEYQIDAESLFSLVFE